MNAFAKQPAERFTIAVEFAQQLPTGASMTSGTIEATDPSGVDAVADVIVGGVAASASTIIIGTESRATVYGGTHGLDYRLRFLVTLSNGNILEEDVLMRVENQ